MSGKFTEKTKRILKDRVGGFCSMSNCRRLTVGPGENDDRTTLIGEAGHIKAANPGGPRYDSKMSDSERGSVTNGIWLCSPCHKKIDSEESIYPVEKLVRLKTEAEQYARKNNGRVLYDKGMVDEEKIKSIATLMHASPCSETSLIDNAHRALKQYYEQDGVMRVDTKYENDLASITVHPINTIRFKLHVTDNDKSFKKRYEAFVNHGEDLVISSNNACISGSDTIEKLLSNEDATFVFPGLEVDGELRLICNTTKECEDVICETFFGKIKYGKLSFVFDGETFNGLLSLKLTHNTSEDNKSVFSMTVNHEVWQGENINRIQYFGRLEKLFSSIKSNFLFVIKVSAKGNDFMKFDDVNLNVSEFVDSINDLIEYIGYVREISKIFDLNITFDFMEDLSSEDYYKVVRIADALSGKYDLHKKDIISNPTISFSPRGLDELQKLLELLKGDEIVEEGNIMVRIFNATYTFKWKSVVTGFSAKLDPNFNPEYEGQAKIELIPKDSYSSNVSVTLIDSV